MSDETYGAYKVSEEWLMHARTAKNEPLHMKVEVCPTSGVTISLGWPRTETVCCLTTEDALGLLHALRSQEATWIAHVARMREFDAERAAEKKAAREAARAKREAKKHTPQPAPPTQETETK